MIENPLLKFLNLNLIKFVFKNIWNQRNLLKTLFKKFSNGFLFHIPQKHHSTSLLLKNHPKHDWFNFKLILISIRAHRLKEKAKKNLFFFIYFSFLSHSIHSLWRKRIFQWAWSRRTSCPISQMSITSNVYRSNVGILELDNASRCLFNIVDSYRYISHMFECHCRTLIESALFNPSKESPRRVSMRIF